MSPTYCTEQNGASREQTANCRILLCISDIWHDFCGSIPRYQQPTSLVHIPQALAKYPAMPSKRIWTALGRRSQPSLGEAPSFRRVTISRIQPRKSHHREEVRQAILIWNGWRGWWRRGCYNDRGPIRASIIRLASATISSERLFSRLEGLSASAWVDLGAKIAALQPFPTGLPLSDIPRIRLHSLLAPLIASARYRGVE